METNTDRASNFLIPILSFGSNFDENFENNSLHNIHSNFHHNSLSNNNNHNNSTIILYLTPRRKSAMENITRFHSGNSSNPAINTEFTQMVSIIAFFAIIILAMSAWILSRHCCWFRRKGINSALSSSSSSTSSSSSSNTAGNHLHRVTVNSRVPLNLQFNFLGVQVLQRLNNVGSSSVITADKPDDVPPSYESLFPSHDISNNCVAQPSTAMTSTSKDLAMTMPNVDSSSPSYSTITTNSGDGSSSHSNNSSSSTNSVPISNSNNNNV